VPPVVELDLAGDFRSGEQLPQDAAHARGAAPHPALVRTLEELEKSIARERSRSEHERAEQRVGVDVDGDRPRGATRTAVLAHDVASGLS
jgi:hypothetical protein